MRHDLIVSQSININASPNKVWNVLTNPVLISEYLYGTETVTDWKPGSEVIFQGEYAHQTYRDKGVVLENVPNQILSYSYWSGFSGAEDKPENYSTITYTLKPIDDKQTEFTWTQQGFATEDGYNHSLNGMEALLNQIKGIAER
ncbi:SRPBCC domain-containing protein [Spirosoma sp. BT702]|uniref:SRPBCC domain-containing protein n=1 Tax=Spirosoma profusum TaxID=2771354 RepID=A0A927AQH2_9BACT|nr:SRPBCC domain-containing protein [Spirosoma profusum]MBD2700421.1 SRPBCC domain-containing protein [Spirosoma profusum]